jgi:hypothetical protein
MILKMNIKPLIAKMMIKAGGAVCRMAFPKLGYGERCCCRTTTLRSPFAPVGRQRKIGLSGLIDFLMNDHIDRIK